MQAHDAGRTSKERIIFRSRASRSLVAVLLLIVLGIAVVAGGKLVLGWNAAHRGTAAGHGTTLSYQEQVALLEQRPLFLPTVKSAGLCPDAGNANQLGYQFGAGPVYANGGSLSTSNWGEFYDVEWFTDPRLTGPVLIRGRDLVTNRDVIFTGTGATGALVASDPSQASPALRAEFVLDASHPTQRESGYGVFPVRQGVPNGWSHCVGFQMDGSTFSETITTAG